MHLEDKFNKLKEYLKNLKKVAVAYSSGVDSTFLLKVSQSVLLDNVIALTVKSDIFPKRELMETGKFCKKNNIKQIIIESNKLNSDAFIKNPENRCYLCKKDFFEKRYGSCI